MLLFTSGTAGAPRAAMLTHGNLAANIGQVQGHPGLRGAIRRRRPRGAAVLPRVRAERRAGRRPAGGLDDGAARPLRRRARGRAHPRARRHDRRRGPDDVRRVPRAPRRAGVARHLRVGAPGGLGRRRAPARARRGVPRASASRSTRATGSPRPRRSSARRPSRTPRWGSIGPPLPGVDVRLVGDDGEDVLAGDPGEIWVRGPNVFAGYWDDPDATDASWSTAGCAPATSRSPTTTATSASSTARRTS